MLTLLTNMPKDVLIAQLKDGLVLLVLGMGTVFIFLVILIYASKLMSKIVRGIEKNHPANAPVEAAAPKAPAVQQKAAPIQSGDDAAVAAAIAAAYDRSKN